LDHIAYESTFIEANRARRREQWPRAVAAYETILASLPESPVVPRDYAEALLGVGRLDEARKWIGRHLARRPDDGEALLLRGEIHIALGRYEAAADDYERIPGEQLSAVATRGRLGVAVLRGDFARARSELEILRERFSGLRGGSRWDEIESAVEHLAGVGVDQPAPGDSGVVRQVRAMLTLGLAVPAGRLLERIGPAVTDPTAALLEAQIACAQRRWCEADAAFARGEALGADLRDLATQRRDAERHCRFRQRRAEEGAP
jgi:tetratricopeptide (TPR) repeat protein